jgi:F-type H+-transporting ATPase subunit gamma
VYLLIGSERGFCGDFNHALLRHYETISLSSDIDQPQLISVGHRLTTLEGNYNHNILFIDGASVAEEIDKVLNQIVNQLASLQQQYQSLDLHVLYHNDEQQIIAQQLLPPFQHLRHQQQDMQAPELNIQPAEFLLDLSYHYLFAVLHEILYTSLMAESRQRLAHLEGAIQHMDEQSEELHRRSNVLRQEEIIEEIEVILLSAVSLDDPLTQY